MSRYARRKDENHGALVEAFKAFGCSVLVLDVSEPHAPDLLIGRNGADQLVETKPAVGERRRSQLRPGQKAWHERWRGRWVDVARTVEDAQRIANGLGMK